MRRLSKKTKDALVIIDAIGKTIKRVWNHFGDNDGKSSKGRVRNLLLVEQWGIGDLVMASYCFPALREDFGAATISVLCSPAAAGLLEGCPYIDNFVAYDFPWTRPSHKYAFGEYQWMSLINLTSKMRKRKFGMALTAFPDPRANLLLWLFGAKSKIGSGSRGGGFFLTVDLVTNDANQHHLSRWEAALRAADCTKGLHKHGLWLSTSELQKADQIISEAGVSKANIIVGIHCGASDPQRRWPLERFVEVAERISSDPRVRVLIFSDPNNYNKIFPCHAGVALPNTNLRTFAALLSRLDVLLCNDSGPMHMAAAVETPVVALFGKSDPREFAPLGQEHTIVEADKMDCRPCYIKCKYSEPKCWSTIKVSEVLQAIEKQILKIKSLTRNQEE